MQEAVTVEMYIDKFEKVVIIDPSHPLAIAQRSKGKPAAKPAKTAITVSGKSVEELGELTKSELITLADKLGIEVRRADGADRDPIVSDYVAALSKSVTE